MCSVRPNGWLIVGEEPASSGTYLLGGSGLLSAAYEYVGYYGSGVFVQTAGTNSGANALQLGYWTPASSGTYSLSGAGLLSAGSEYIGTYGAGTFIQTGGTNNFVSTLVLGYAASSSGTYSLSGSGVLSAATETRRVRRQWRLQPIGRDQYDHLLTSIRHQRNLQSVWGIACYSRTFRRRPV